MVGFRWRTRARARQRHPKDPSALLQTTIFQLFVVWSARSIGMSSATASTSLSVLADPPPRLMDAAALEYFLIELVPTLRTSSEVANARAKKVEDEMIAAGLLPPPPPPPKTKTNVRDSINSTTTTPEGKGPIDEEEESVYARLEAIGMHVGTNITERYRI